MWTSFSLPSKSPFIVFLMCMVFLVASTARAEVEARVDRIVNGLRPYAWVIVGDEPRLDIGERMEYYNVPGVSIAVIEKGNLAWARAYGVRNTETNEPVETTTLFEAGSVSKSLNAMVVVSLSESGRFALGDAVNEHLISWRLPPSPYTANRPVTISQLLNHTGGTTNFNDRTGYMGYRRTDPMPTVQQILAGEPPALTQPVSVEREPGAFHYSNGGAVVLQLLVMETAGKPYQAILEEMIFGPLGMDNSTFSIPLPTSLEARAASAHSRMRPLEGGYYVYPELALFIIEHWKALHGRSKRIISPASARWMITPSGPDTDAAAGFFITRKGSETYYGHRGGNYGFYTDMIIREATGDGAVVMDNGGSDGVRSNMRREILNAIAEEYGWKDFLAPPITVATDPAQTVAGFAGRYQVNADCVIEISVQDEVCTVTSPEREFRSGVRAYPTVEGELVAKSIRPMRFRLVRGASASSDTLVMHDAQMRIAAPRILADQRPPYELLLSGEIELAVDRYDRLRQADPNDELVSERRINSIGYWILNQEKVDAAIALFALNTAWYPQSANTHDSLGEAYALAGNADLAIRSYRRALELAPESVTAREALRRLEDIE
jgi:CubicO group peptidase (beta-lactamase class C family)